MAVVELEREGPLAWITLNRPEKLNAFTDELLAEFDRLLEQEKESDSRVIVIKGAGRAFSAGYDVSAEGNAVAPGTDPVEVRDRKASYMERCLRIWDHPKPVIAQVHGYCMAGATQLCVFCDITVVTSDAVITGSPALPLGGGFISPVMASLIGPKRAKQMSFIAGDRIDGNTAVEWGWANFAVDADRIESAVRELALSVAKTPASLLRLKKAAVNRAMEMQGLRTAAMMGTETNTLAHETNAVRQLHDLIRDVGLTEAIRRFEAGETGLPSFDMGRAEE